MPAANMPAALAPLRVLITGFAPFPGVADNASAPFAGLLGQEAARRRPAWQVTAATLPTEWEGAPVRLAALVADAQPAVCLHLGVAASARGLVIETQARNAAGRKPDAAGRLPPRPVLIEDAPALLMPACQPLPVLAAPGRCGLPVSVSHKAGDYVCNALFFHALWRARQQPAGAAGRRLISFVHLPLRIGGLGLGETATAHGGPLDLDVALAAGLMLLDAMGELASAAPAIRAAGAETSVRA